MRARVAHAVALLALAVPLTGCAFSPQFLACLISGDLATEECRDDSVAPGPPAPPTGVVAQADLAARAIVVTWDESLEPDLAEDFPPYTVYRSTVAGGPYELRGSAESPSFTEVAWRYPACTPVFYVVTVVDELGQRSAFSAEASVRTPCEPARLTATPGDGRVDLSWLAPDSGGASVFQIMRAPAATGPFDRIGLTTSTGGLVRWSDERAPNGVELFYRLLCLCPDGELTSETVSTMPTGDDPPSPPTGLLATAGDATVQLDWDDGAEADLAGYNVYRASSESDFTRINDPVVTSSEYVDTDVVNGTAYRYYVTAVDAGGNESSPALWILVTPRADDEAPVPPTGVTASSLGSDGGNVLEWDANAEPDLAGYNVYAAEDPTGPFSKLNEVLLTDTFYRDFSGVAGTSYYVTAVDADGDESDPSAVVTAIGPSSLRLLTASADRRDGARRVFPFRLTVSGDYAEGGRVQVVGRRIEARDLVYDGPFELQAAAPDGRHAGHWRTRLDWVLDPRAGTGSAHGLALAVLAEGKGQACLRFDDVYAVERRGARSHLAISGTFTLVGGTGEAARLLGSGTYRVSVRRDGTHVYRGFGRRAAGPVPALPAECLALAEAP